MNSKEAYLSAMLKKATILFAENGFDLSIMKDIKLRCLNIKKEWDGYYETPADSNFSFNKRNGHEIVINSKINNGLHAAEALIHELCHAVQYDLHGEDCSFHGKEFKAIASSVGLDASRPKTTPALPALEAKIQEWGREIGTYPHTVPMPKETKMLEVIGELVLNLLFFATFLFLIGGSVYLIILTAYEYFLI